MALGEVVVEGISDAERSAIAIVTGMIGLMIGFAPEGTARLHSD